MAPSRITGRLAQSSSGSGIFYQGDDVTSPGQGSVVTDANSAYPTCPSLQRNTSFNSDTYRLPASPLSFSSTNVSISGSSVMDVQNTNNNSLHIQKKPRLDIKQEDVVMQHMMQRQNQNPQLQALIQQQRFRQQQQQLLQSMPPAQRAHVLQEHQMRQQIHSQTIPPIVNRPNDNGICSRRLMKYLYHLRQHPPENTIAYWRKFVAEYYSPHAKKRWCLSLYNNVGNHSLGVFPQANMDAWHCEICGSKSGKGFEATFEVLPRLNRIKFASGVIDELLFLDLPRESTFPSGIMMLEYGKAVEESVYEQLRVVREGHLRIIFSPDLKILSWEFCSRRHEELLPRRLFAPQVNNLVQVAQKCQNTITESKSEGISQQDLQTNSNMVVTAGRQLAKTLELPSLNDLGFSKTYVRCLQIAEVVGSMKNLMDICKDQKVGPIESLKTYPCHIDSSKIQMQNRHDMANIVNGQMNHAQNVVGQGGFGGSAQAAIALTNYQNMLIRQNSTNSNNSNENSSSTFLKKTGNTTASLQSSSFINGFNSSHQQQMIYGSEKKNQNLSISGQSGYGNVMQNSIADPAPRGSSNIKVASNNESSPCDRGNEDDHKADNKPQNDPLSDDMVKDIADAFIENGFFSSDFNDNVDFGWKI